MDDKLEHIQLGDMLEYRSISRIERIGPVVRLHNLESGRRLVLVMSKKAPGVEISVELPRILAVFRNGHEIIRFDQAEA